MRRCAKCIMPDTKMGITFDERGVCNACQNAEAEEKIDWRYRWLLLQRLICSIYGTHKVQANTNEYLAPNLPKSKYHCIIPVSGGKDSTYLAFKAKELGLTPLCVNVAPCQPTERGERNLANLSRQGFDIFRFLPNQKIMPKLVKRSFREDGDPCTSHEFMLYAVPVRVAMQYKIPLIIWAENSAVVYGNLGNTDADDQKNIVGLWGRDASHWLCDGVTEKDLIPFQHPTADEIRAAGLKAIYLSDYIRWDSRKVADFAVEHGLEVRTADELPGTGGYWGFEQLDDESPVIGHYLKYKKFGYGRATDHACRDIRLGYMTRDEGLKLAQKYDGHLNPDYIKRFCKYINITEKEFHRVCERFTK